MEKLKPRHDYLELLKEYGFKLDNVAERCKWSRQMLHCVFRLTKKGPTYKSKLILCAALREMRLDLDGIIALLERDLIFELARKERKPGSWIPRI